MITSTDDFGRDVDDIDALVPDPVTLMLAWLPVPASEKRPLMTLATVDAEGYPSARNVLLSRADADGLFFHTDDETRKVGELELLPRACIALAWPAIGRQLIVQGDVERTPAEEARATFDARSRYLQLLAWQNNEANAALPRDERRREWARFDAGHPELVPPAGWVGFLLRPRRITFWRGDPEGPSNRHEYRRVEGSWRGEILPG